MPLTLFLKPVLSATMNTKQDNKVWVGLDVGAISVKAAIATETDITPYTYKRTHGRPIERATDILEEIREKFGPDSVGNVVVTGSGGKALVSIMGADHINEFHAITLALRYLNPGIKTIFEIGGQTSKYILLDKTGIIDYGINGDCAAGTGSFLDQQAARLHYKIEDVGEVTKEAEKSARIAGRCSVFAKSDMIHAQQMGYLPSEVLKGLCLAVARNFKATIVKGRKIKKPAAFIGGVAKNAGMVTAMNEVFGYNDELHVPENAEYFGAMGCALEAKSQESTKTKSASEETFRTNDEFAPEALSTKEVIFLRDRVNRRELPEDVKTDVYLGIDIGSVSTNFVILDTEGNLIYDIYTMTKARPIEVVGECLRDIEKNFGDKIEVKGVGTTGSGRELIGELIGADTVRDEITAHKTGAVHIARTMTDGEVDTIFEIGGQDSKFISIENGVVVDFTMNEACAAGTGSFLEEQAEKLGIQIKGEFAELALSSDKPLKLGERCTVFMERDVNAFQLRGSKVADITSGLAYSVVLNYLNRVVRGRKIGEKIFFQGGTAYNDAVAAAFSKVLGKRIIVPPHNGVMGAIGAGLLAMQIQRAKKTKTTFRGFNIKKVDYSIREFTCKACTNECDVQEFTVDGSKTYWGDKCSSKYRKKAKTEAKPLLSDLFAEREKLLLERPSTSSGRTLGKTIGIPRAMYFFDRFPFWQTYLNGIGFNVVVSDETNKKIVQAGISARVAEPCHPIGVAHGHVKDLLDKNVDYIWLPNILTAEPNGQTHVRPYLCPWGMTLPYVVTSSPLFEQHKSKFLAPTLHHMHGPDFLGRQLYNVAKELGIKKGAHKRAFYEAMEAQKRFNEKKVTLGEMALHKLNELGGEAVVLVGRPYNLFDLHVNLNVPTKMRKTYGVDVIPMDLLPVPATNIEDVADQMFWNYGNKIISTAKFIGKHKNLHMIYITNFKCGPDSFIKHFTKNACGKPFLTLQFDEHSNDAGVMTRIEAYLDSKKLLKTSESPVAADPSSGPHNALERSSAPPTDAKENL